MLGLGTLGDIGPDGSVTFMSTKAEPRGGEGSTIITYGPQETTEIGQKRAEGDAKQAVGE